MGTDIIRLIFWVLMFELCLGASQIYSYFWPKFLNIYTFLWGNFFILCHITCMEMILPDILKR